MPVLQSKPGVNYSPYQSVNTNPTASRPQSTNTTPTTSGSGLGASTGFGTGGSSAAAPQATPQNNGIQNQLDAGNSQIEADYQNYLSALNNQQSSLNSQGDLANQSIDNQAASAKTALQQQQAVGQQGLDTQANTANKQATTATQQARDLYRQMQQQNVAQLSGAGLSSSSVAEALAEKLGVETARRIAGVTGSQQEILQNIDKERSTLNDYVSGKLTDLSNQVSTQKATIQSQLVDGLNQINQARQVAASDKAARRQDLMINAQNAIASLQSQAQQFAQSLQLYQQQNASRLAQVGQDLPGLLQQLGAAAQQATSLQGFQGLSPTPSFNVGSNGAVSGSLNFTKPKDPNSLDALLNQAGIQ